MTMLRTTAQQHGEASITIDITALRGARQGGSTWREVLSEGARLRTWSDVNGQTLAFSWPGGSVAIPYQGSLVIEAAPACGASSALVDATQATQGI